MSATRSRPPAKKSVSAPVQLGRRTADAAREPLFSVGDQVYTMPATVPTGDAIMLAARLRLQPDEDAKGVALVLNLCGGDALAALMGDSTMTRAEWKTIVRILTERAFGPAERRKEDEEGN